MSKFVRNKKSQKLDPKAIFFWGAIAAITLALIISLIVVFVQQYKATDKDDIEYLTRNEIYLQEENKYFVLVYGFNAEDSEELEYFEEVVLSYQTFLKKYYGKKVDGEEKAFKLYGVDTENPSNYLIVVDKADKQNILDTTSVKDSFITDETTFLRIFKDNLPTLLVVENGVVTDYHQGESTICKFLDEIMKLYTDK